MVKCQIGVCRSDENENSPDSCKNGQVQIMVSVAAGGAGVGMQPGGRALCRGVCGQCCTYQAALQTCQHECTMPRGQGGQLPRLHW